MANLWGEGLGADLDQLIAEFGEALENSKSELEAKKRWLDGNGPQTEFDGLVDVGPERPVDGFGSNPLNEDWGSSGQQLLRLGDADFGDDIGTLGGQDRPNPRVISNTVSQQTEDTPSQVGASDFLWAWGQFIDHDLDLTEAGHSEFAPIFVPDDDPAFPEDSMIPFTRVDPLEGTGENSPREYPNEITAFLDASMVYGSDDATAAGLRVAGGKLLLDEDDLLVLNGVNPMAGDVRAGENIGLTSLHTLFARDHNWWVDRLAERDPSLTDDELYHAARQRVEAEIQSITYKEFLPLLLGENALPDYTGFDDTVNPGISVEFSTAVYRLGHSMLSTTIHRLNEDGSEIDAGNIGLRDAFFAPQEIAANGGIAPILRGLAGGTSQDIDTRIVEDVRSFLFGQPGAGGLDLASLNIQRGRDLGVPDYNSLREAIGLERVTSFAEITSDAALAQTLEDLYGDVDNIDAWIGGLAEDRFGDSLVGETFHLVLVDQFARIRDGDPFFSKASNLPEEELNALWSTKLSDVIERNGDVDVSQDNVFLAFSRLGGSDFDDTLEGGDQRDLLIGGGGSDILLGNDGDDQLEGGEEIDFLGGSEGNDTLRGGAGDDIVEGGTGNDSIGGGDGDDLLSAEAGDDLVFGDGGRDTVIGDFGNDTIDGGADDDTLDGGFDNDLVLGAGGADMLIGGMGDDTLDGGDESDGVIGGFGDDSLSGGDGNDILDGGLGDDGFLGGAGNDAIFGNFGSDLISGGEGRDTVNAGGNDDAVDGGAGDDILDGDLGDDLLIGGEGADQLIGGMGADSLDGCDGDDSLTGGFDNDLLVGGSGSDSMDGGIGNDELLAGDDADNLDGGFGDDTLNGGEGGDSLSGNFGVDELMGDAGNDTLDGGFGDDTLDGGDDNDLLFGAADDDSMRGGNGNDTLMGGDGKDELEGGLGDDELFGGAGIDHFRFFAAFGHDVLQDFSEVDRAYLLVPLGVDSLNDLQIDQTEQGARVHVTDTSSILFSGWSVEDLDGADLVFLP